MPEKLHDALQREARSKIRTRRDIRGNYPTVREARDAYVYGGMRQSGWKPGPPQREEGAHQ